MKSQYKNKIEILKKEKELLRQEILLYQSLMENMRRGINLDHLLKLMIRSIQKGLGFQRCGIFFLEPDGKHIELAMGVDVKGRFEKRKDRLPITSRRGENLFSDLINGYKKYFLTNNVSKRMPERLKYRVPVKSNAAVPIQVGKSRYIGVLTIEDLKGDRKITKFEVSRLMNYATQIGLIIESYKNHEQMLKLSSTDPLTGLFNRRHFEETAIQELNRCQRYHRSFCLLILDLDHFKKVNDLFGHDAGDVVLKQVAGLLRGNVRTLDMVARIGGEEFAILLPETPPNNIFVVIKRLLKVISAAKPEVSAMAQKNRNITMSIGLAQYKSGKVTYSEIFKAADKSLYYAKSHGRNRSGPLSILSK